MASIIGTLIMYQLIDFIPGKPAPQVKRLADNAFIPFDEQNVDYVAYLAWLAEGNVPAPAEEINQGEPQ